MQARKQFYDDDLRGESIEKTDGVPTAYYGSNVFNDAAMKARLPKNTYTALRRTIDEGAPLDHSIAEVVANAMKDWAIEKGATHFTHWFQPMTGVTAEKHESFISPTKDGKVIMEFSGKELIKGEPDASSFPSGGLRSTFEARGYTAWDCTSPAFLKEDQAGVTLCIPTAFCSYTGEALDQKTPLLRSMEALSKQAVRVLAGLGDTKTARVSSMAGPEQEYFLIDKSYYDRRKDLILTGRTLFGARAPKGQELDDHYYASIEERIAEYMKELDTELWKLGVPARTKHNEVAPSQYELAIVYASANVATDYNQLTMEVMQKVASRHHLACLLHEKPFAGINGSGKHNNWSLCTDHGVNLLQPGKTPEDNLRFLLFICAVIEAVDDYADLYRLSAAVPGNDHRLGANEAPPAIVSMFLGDQLTGLLRQISDGEEIAFAKKELLKIGVSTLPTLPKDLTDRNRTSPMAFTGNKFEFRMVPSSASIALPNTVLNTTVAESLSRIADRLENAGDVDEEAHRIIKDIYTEHKRIIFNGNGYSKEWIEEAAQRGLKNIPSTIEAISAYTEDSSVSLFEKHHVFSRKELESRYQIALEGYIKQLNIEAMTMIDIAKRQILPASVKYAHELAQTVNSVREASGEASTETYRELLRDVVEKTSEFNLKLKSVESALNEAQGAERASYRKALLYKDHVLKGMQSLRESGDQLEEIVDSKLWPMPTYSDMLFNI